jgi:hypothetical protein
VDHAETTGGDIAEYFRRLFPRYWFESDRLPPGIAGPSMGLTPDREIRMLADMSKIVLPAFRASPEYGLPHDAASLRFPPRGS